MKAEPCPQQDKHTPCPSGYVEWHDWAAKMSETHKQVRCSGCGLYAIWKRKETFNLSRKHVAD